MAFDEGVLLDQDRFLSAVLARPEFQRKMTGTELRNRLGQFFAAQEKSLNLDAPASSLTTRDMFVPPARHAT